MRTLLHFWLSPFCRKVRLVLDEKRAEFQMEIEADWDRNEDLLKLNPAGELPVLVEADGSALSGSDAICEYLDELYPEPSLFGRQALARAEARRLIYWFDRKFYWEVTKNLVDEKITKRLRGFGEPESQSIRTGYANIHQHLNYIAYLVDRRNWLAGNEMTLADLTAAAHLSCIDYVGDVPWEQHMSAKNWYARVKSRPSFRSILQDQVPGTLPAKHYTNLDF